MKITADSTEQPERGLLPRKNSMPPELAVQEIVNYEKNFGSQNLKLACHAAFPFILTPELVNLIHINFLDSEKIPWIAETELLLSSLCRPAGDDLFQVDPALRQVLLAELENRFGWFRLYELANFLLFYLNKLPQKNKEAAEIHHWLARSYIEPDRVIEELNDFLDGPVGTIADRDVLADQIRLTHIVEITSEVLEKSGSEKYPQLQAKSRALARLMYIDVQKSNGPDPAPSVIKPFHDFLSDRTPGPAMIFLASGTFSMGDDKSDRDDEKPAHSVTLNEFSVGQYPVTFEEYDRFCEAVKRRKPDDMGWGREKRPVINVSWEDATAYCEWLNGQTKQEYRLLTEAEWEYACRAESDTAYCFGDDENLLAEYAWYNEEWGKGSTHPAGEKKPNAFGLYDVHGNVWEWLYDCYEKYPKDAQTDPSGSNAGSRRVIRGGSRLNDAVVCRSAFRYRYDPGYRHHNLGFRLARTNPLPSYPFTLPEMVCLPPGTFRMGDSQGVGTSREKPVHEVTLSSFFIARYPVTFAEYDQFCEAVKREKPEDEGWGRDKRPVINVSWEDA
ncbi:MAG: formylglycine-generating enzyme family protein, partial [Gammaproteobacteria bacterium]|nr:formylglycine-generating enzyme family protein [Gammaproteobacteria bacterium]